MIRFLIWVLVRFVFVFGVVPAIFVGAFVGLVRLGFSPRLLEVWGLAVVAGSLALLPFKLVEAIKVKLLGPSEAPELPASARRGILGIFGLGGAGLASAAAFGLLAFVTVGSWWRLEEPMGLGLVIVEPNPGAGANHYLMTFEPSRGDKGLGVEGVEIGGDVVAFEVRTVRFEGTAATVVSQLGLTDVAWPGEVTVKIDEALPDEAGAGTLAVPPSWATEKVLQFLEKVPGTTLERIRSPFFSLEGGFRKDLVLESGEVKLVSAGAGPKPQPPKPPPPPPTRKPPPPTTDPGGPDGPDPGGAGGPGDPSRPTDPGTPGDPGGGPPGGEPGDGGSGGPNQGRPPSAAEIAMLRTGDPFEGLD